MRRNRTHWSIPFFISGIIIFTGIVFGSTGSMAFAGDDWIVNVNHGEFLDLNPLTTQWLMIKEHFSAITLIDAKIAVFERQAENKSWVEVQRIGPPDVVITTFRVKDINGDGIGEIIAGTVEPGFIYIYKLNGGKWELFNYGKYVWSAINNIIVGNFDGAAGNDILVQNQEGFLYLLKITDNSLDLIWKSPIAWRPIISGFVKDIDNDSKEEILIVYKTGGIAVLKVDNNSIVSAWENYLWGKVLDVATGDWDNDQQSEFMISTSQKVVYFLGWHQEKQTYQFEKQWSQLDCILEELAFIKNNELSQLLATDTAGKFHLYQYDFKNSVWNERFVCQTGRIAQIIDINPDRILLWGLSRKLVTVQTLMAQEIKLKYRDRFQDLFPAATYKNEYLYVAPKALQIIPDLSLKIKTGKTGFTITKNDQTIQIAKKTLDIKVNGDPVIVPQPPLVIDGDLFLTLDSFQAILGISLAFDFPGKAVVLPDSSLSNPEPTPVSGEAETMTTDQLSTDSPESNQTAPEIQPLIE